MWEYHRGGGSGAARVAGVQDAFLALPRLWQADEGIDG